MSYARMQSEETRLQTEIEQFLAEAEAIDAADDARYGSDRRGR